MAFVTNSAFFGLVPRRGCIAARSPLRQVTIRAETETEAPPSTPPPVPSPAEVSAPTGPVVPEGFQAPEPRRFYVRPDRAVDIVTASLGTFMRVGTGALIEGYNFSGVGSGTITESSSTLPQTRPQYAIRVFEFEACPFCRKVREAICMLDLDVLVFPTPKNGTTYREYVKDKGGKSQFPYVEDPNTGWAGYESADIIEYLYRTYGPQSARPPPFLGPLGTFPAGLASMFRAGKGSTREERVVPAAKPLELYAYEPSPFSKVVRERLVELELPYYLHTTPRGSPTREELRERTGQMQVPYLIDHNTGVNMFESADIVDYLTKTYGKEAPGAIEKPAMGQSFLPAFVEGDDGLDVIRNVTEPSLNPETEKDEVLEEFCKDKPEADECRVYEE